jgi:hypothetical protein
VRYRGWMVLCLYREQEAVALSNVVTQVRRDRAPERISQHHPCPRICCREVSFAYRFRHQHVLPQQYFPSELQCACCEYPAQSGGGAAIRPTMKAQDKLSSTTRRDQHPSSLGAGNGAQQKSDAPIQQHFHAYGTAGRDWILDVKFARRKRRGGTASAAATTRVQCHGALHPTSHGSDGNTSIVTDIDWAAMALQY